MTFFTVHPTESWTFATPPAMTWTLTDDPDRYQKPIEDGDLPPNVGDEPSEEELEDGADDAAETEEEEDGSSLA